MLELTASSCEREHSQLFDGVVKRRRRLWFSLWRRCYEQCTITSSLKFAVIRDPRRGILDYHRRQIVSVVLGRLVLCFSIFLLFHDLPFRVRSAAT